MVCKLISKWRVFTSIFSKKSSIFFHHFLRKVPSKSNEKSWKRNFWFFLQARLSLSTYRLKILPHNFAILSYKWFSKNFPFVEYLSFVVRIPVRSWENIFVSPFWNHTSAHSRNIRGISTPVQKVFVGDFRKQHFPSKPWASSRCPPLGRLSIYTLWRKGQNVDVFSENICKKYSFWFHAAGEKFSFNTAQKI